MDIFGVVAKRTRFRLPGRASVDATGMLPTAISSAGTVTVRSNVARSAGSSQLGTKRRASESSNIVKRDVASPSGVVYLSRNSPAAWSWILPL